QLVSQAFSRKTVAELAPRVTEITTDLLDAARGKERFDLVEDVAYPLPVTVIAEMIGVPASDKELFRVWADGIFDPNVNADAENDADTIKARVKPMQDYFHEHVGDRRRTPRGDLITGLTQAEVEGDRLDDEEIVTFLTILLIAGHITTTLMLGNTVRCLHERPDIHPMNRGQNALFGGDSRADIRLLSWASAA
ncbi:cytochrome P450, partial [Kibdelosporangium lantanae]